MTELEVINRIVDVDGTKKDERTRGVWLTTNFVRFIFPSLFNINTNGKIHNS